MSLPNIIVPGETNADKRTIFFPIYDKDGLIASGDAQGITDGWATSAITLASGDLQYAHNRGGYVAIAGTFGHNGEGEYYYIFDPTEIANSLSDGTVAVKFVRTGYRAFIVRIPFYNPNGGLALTTDVTSAQTAINAHTDSAVASAQTAIIAAIPTTTQIATAILDAARSGHVVLGSIGEGIALAASLLQGNFYIDNTNNTDPNGQTAARIRCFHTGTAAAAATPGGSGQGEFATFLVTTSYTGPNQIASHRVVQQ